MERILLKSKLHRVRTTDVDIHYIGSIGIDEALMNAADILPYEKVVVANIENGARFETYAVPQPRNSGKITVYGAAARLVRVGDLLIIFSFGIYTPEEVAHHTPRKIFVDKDNKQTTSEQS